MKRKLHRYNINRPMLRHGDKYTQIYTKYKIQLSIMMDACIKQHQSNIWRSIYENVKQ